MERGTAGPVSTGDRPSSPADDVRPPEATRIEDIRSLVYGADECIYFQTSGLSLKLKPVLEASTAWTRFQASGPAKPDVGSEIAARVEESRAAVADALGADADEIMLQENTTVGINVVAAGIDWHAGDEVILSNHEHPGNRIPWYNVANLYGVTLRYLDFGLDDARLLAQLEELLSDRTRVVAVSHVSRRTGRRIPAAALVDAAHRRNVPVLLDGAQAFGAVPVDLHEIGCDYYAFSGHKYIMAPQGTGGCFVRRDRIDAIRPSWIGSHSQSWMDNDGHMTLHDAARRFEFGTRNLADQIAFGTALEVWRSVGWDAVYGAIERYTDHMKRRLLEVPGIELRTPLSYADSSGIVTVRIPGLDAAAVTHRLFEEERIIVSQLDGETESLRVSTHVFNTTDEAEALAAALSRYTAER